MRMPILFMPSVPSSQALCIHTTHACTNHTTILCLCLLLSYTPCPPPTQKQLGHAIQAVSVGGCFNMTEAGLLQLVTEHPNRQK